MGEDKEITENLTQDKINLAKQMVLNVRDIDDYEIEKSFEMHDLHIDIYRAQTQLNKKLGIPEETTIKSFSGESETWKINDYKIEIDPKRVQTAPGTISMKGKQTFMADYFKVEAHISFKDVFSGEDHKIYEFELTPEKPTLKNGEITDVKIGELNIARQKTSHTFRIPILNKYNEPVSLDDVLQTYFIIEWGGLQDETNKRERIDLKSNGG
ncbi:hypothetical protein [Robertmurraya korlensis]|uniref:hypothetical protein n=1 Tax=Robertmurraya korlensis TaxID=519977 RepID=UPI00082477D0|nr:hypothetical protein [Robertmurraya korlensis]